MVVDHGVHILISDLLTGTGLGPAQDPPPASIRYSAQFLDVHMDQFAWAVPHITDRCPGGAVQIRKAGQTPTGEHPVDGGTRHPQAPGHQMGAFLLGDPIRNDPLFHLRRDPTGTVARPRGTILQSGFSFLLETSHPPIGSLPRNPHRFGGPSRRPTQLEDPIHQQPTPERCQLSTVGSHEGLLLIRGMLLIPRIKPGGLHSSKHSVNHVHGKDT